MRLSRRITADSNVMAAALMLAPEQHNTLGTFTGISAVVEQDVYVHHRITVRVKLKKYTSPRGENISLYYWSPFKLASSTSNWRYFQQRDCLQHQTIEGLVRTLLQELSSYVRQHRSEFEREPKRKHRLTNR